MSRYRKSTEKYKRSSDNIDKSRMITDKPFIEITIHASSEQEKSGCSFIALIKSFATACKSNILILNGIFIFFVLVKIY